MPVNAPDQSVLRPEILERVREIVGTEHPVYWNDSRGFVYEALEWTPEDTLWLIGIYNVLPGTYREFYHKLGPCRRALITAYRIDLYLSMHADPTPEARASRLASRPKRPTQEAILGQVTALVGESRTVCRYTICRGASRKAGICAFNVPEKEGSIVQSKLDAYSRKLWADHRISLRLSTSPDSVPRALLRPPQAAVPQAESPKPAVAPTSTSWAEHLRDVTGSFWHGFSGKEIRLLDPGSAATEASETEASKATAAPASISRMSAYLHLQAAMLDLDGMKEEDLADRVRDVMDPLWYGFSDEEIRLLDLGLIAVVPSTALAASPVTRLLDEDGNPITC